MNEVKGVFMNSDQSRKHFVMALLFSRIVNDYVFGVNSNKGQGTK